MEKIKVNDLQKVESTNIAEIAYIEKTNNLFVKFKNNNLYLYDAVDREVYDNFKTAESAGKYFNQFIRQGGFSYSKLENTELEQEVKEVKTDLKLENNALKKQVEDLFLALSIKTKTIDDLETENTNLKNQVNILNAELEDMSNSRD